jgi:hypothetical protein
VLVGLEWRTSSTPWGIAGVKGPKLFGADAYSSLEDFAESQKLKLFGDEWSWSEYYRRGYYTLLKHHRVGSNPSAYLNSVSNAVRVASMPNKKSM